MLLVACFYNLANYPTIWWDEAIFSETAANFAQKGRYALTVQSPDHLSDLDFRISTGPAVILPVALSYRVLGVNVVNGRLVAAAYLLLAFLALFLGARYLWGTTTALVAVALALLGTDVLYWGRSVLGDVPALGFFLLGIWSTMQGLDSDSGWPLFLGGLFLGLAFGAKEFYGLAFLPPILVLLPRHRHNFRHLMKRLIIFFSGIFIPLLGYLVLKIIILGSLTQAVNHFLVQKMLLRHEFFTPLTIGRVYPESFAYLLGHPLFWLGILGGYWCWHKNGPSPGLTLWLVNFFLWSLVYLMAVYWHRFALPALFLAAPPAASLLCQLVSRLVSAFSHHFLRACAAAILAVFAFLCYPLAGTDILTVIASSQATAPERFYDYLKAHIPSQSLIETPEYELVFLDDEHHFHLMPAHYFVESEEGRVVLMNPRARKYDFNKIGADFLVLGSFGKSVFRQIYPPAKVEGNWQKIAQVGFYDIYVRRSAESPEAEKSLTN